MGETCRESCSRACEPLAGSAGAAADWIGIEWAKPRWHEDRASLSEGLPPALAELEDARESTGQKLALRVFQRAARARASGVEVVAFRAGTAGFRAAAVPLERVAPMLADWLEGGARPPGSAPLGPEIFVCTDGRHDRCCAVHGRPVHAALAAEVARRGLAVGVAEVSHLGGHRFAANCLALPGGHLYGRVEPDDAPALVDAVLAGRVLAKRLRGRLGTPELVQVAEDFLRTRFPDLTRCEIAKPDTLPAAGSLRVSAIVHLASGVRELELECGRDTFELPASCGDAAKPTVRWVATRLIDGSDAA